MSKKSKEFRNTTYKSETAFLISQIIELDHEFKFHWSYFLLIQSAGVKLRT